MEEETNVKDLLKKLVEQNQQIIEEKQSKPWKVPWKARVKPKQISKGFATVQVIRNNGSVDFYKCRVDEDGCVNIDGFPRLSTAEYRLVHKNTPWYIIPEWSMKPISLVDNYAETERDRMNVARRRVILGKLEREKIKGKKMGRSMIWWIVGGLIVLGVIYYFAKNAGWL